ncbi:GNAT family N-acetyltransferase [Paucibacter sp. APW11]|uniref:GNAT family N-acetyltransferase n=1 Tax=Roseateles aquae TaxID=3077235 RepID=A0ABU3PD69_9BURK|nr:GNAT family N-acetyltransferase [Paucibacter sp. APW11]MDT9000542.1 GNAT family N-acetyltransferase [Paucibacter sp. APW11]
MNRPLLPLSAALPLQGEHTRLRRMSGADLASFHGYRSDPEVARLQGWSTMSEDEALDFLRQMAMLPLGLPGQWCQIGVAARDTDQLIGDIGLCLRAAETGIEAEIGFSLARQWQGRGLAREAVQLLLDWLLAPGRCQRVLACTDERNGPSIALLQRCGFQPTSREQVVYKGEACIELGFERR